jgi:hypothetical protein
MKKNDAVQVDDLANQDFQQFRNIIGKFLTWVHPPGKDVFINMLTQVNEILENENPEVRPHDTGGRPGGLIYFNRTNNLIMLPDLHARRQFLGHVLDWEAFAGDDVLNQLENGTLSMLCLGDGVHSEGALAGRWRDAFNEYLKGYKKCPNMDAEIADSFNLMLVIMALKIRYPERFHFLKGNHENILNETGNGNYAFAKYANEGAMVFDYFRKFYNEEILNGYARFEKNLPLFVVGSNFLASHAEPEYSFDLEEIVNFREQDGMIESLTWTDNYTSEEGALDSIITNFIPEDNESIYYFGGHRPIRELYNQINDDRYVQIHNPRKEIVVKIDQSQPLDLDNDVIEIPSQSSLETEQF